MLPRVKIFFQNGTIGGASLGEDGVLGLVATGTTVANKFELGKAYILRSLDGLADLGITDAETDPNAAIYGCLKQFYSEAPEGTEVWLTAYPDTAKQSDLVDKTKDYAKKLILSAKGKLRGLFVLFNPATGYTPEIEDGLDKDIKTAMLNAQALADWSTDTLFAPLFVLLEGRNYSGDPAELADLKENDYNRVAVLIGDTVANSKGAAIGLLAGRVASIPVQRSIARVKDGAVSTIEAFIGSKAAELGNPESIHDKGYITFRTFVGKAGYFFSDDNLATKLKDDYRLLPRRRTIDKACRIAYQTLIEELNEEIPVTDSGELVAPMVKAWEQKVESAIMRQMTSEGNLGIDPADPNDSGVKCFIDYKQKIIATSQLEVVLRIKPYGYAKYIDIKLGFQTQIS